MRATDGGVTWSCPHCGARQAESGRCWVCHRSSTCCATCANFRPSVASGLGFCAMDRTRAALRGDELRGCWQAPVAELITIGPPAIADKRAARTAGDPAEPPSPGDSDTPRGWLPVGDASAATARPRR